MTWVEKETQEIWAEKPGPSWEGKPEHYQPEQYEPEHKPEHYRPEQYRPEHKPEHKPEHYGQYPGGFAANVGAASHGAAAGQAGNVEAGVAAGASAAAAHANVQLAAAPTDFITAEGALPVIEDVFYFNDGSHFGLDRSDLVYGSDRYQQAQEINKNIPASIQQAFSRGEINYYEPGSGKYYYIRKCDGDKKCYIVQVDRRTNSYKTPEGMTRFIKLNIKASKFRFFHSKIISKSFKVTTNETLPKLSNKFGIPFSFLQSANPNGPSGGSVSIPASAHKVSGGETRLHCSGSRCRRLVHQGPQ